MAAYLQLSFFYGKSFIFGEAFQIMSFSVSLFASLQLDWAITTGRLLGPATCLLHKDGGVSLSVLSKNKTNELAGLFSTATPFVLSAEQGNWEHHF